MEKVVVRPFSGTIPALDPSLLPNRHAQQARNCYLKNGILKPSKGVRLEPVDLVQSTQTVYRYNREANNGQGFLFEFQNKANVVESPIVDDPYMRVYFSGQGSPKFTANDVATAGAGPYPSGFYDLGLPAPNAFIATPTEPTVAERSEGVELTVTYVATFVDKYGQEGPPSLATEPVSRWDTGGSVLLDGVQVPSGNFVIQSKRIYRAELQGVYQLIGEIDPTDVTFNDTVKSEFAGVMLPSETWQPPHEEMIGLMALPNGVMMGWWDNNIAFSEPYRPWAWPFEYRHKLEYEVVGAGLSDVGIVVATRGKPYLLTGAGPDSMTETKLDITQGCVSGASVVDMGGYVAYASTEGLVGNSSVLTAGHMTAEQWRDLDPESIHARRWNDRYLAFYGSGNSAGAFTFHPEEGFLWYDSPELRNTYQDQHTGDVYLIDGAANSWLWSASDSTSETAVWRSRRFDAQSFSRPGAVKIHFEPPFSAASNTTFRFYTDGVLAKEVTGAGRKSFRLPNTNSFETWEFEVETQSPITAIQIAGSMSEIT